MAGPAEDEPSGAVAEPKQDDAETSNAKQDDAKKAGIPGTWAKGAFWVLAPATLAGIALLVVALRPDPGLWISLLAVWLVFWLALWLVAFVSKEPSAKDIGVALLTGLVLAGAAFVLNFVLEEALASRDRERREAETKLAINRREQLVFRGADFRDFDLTGMALVSSDSERFDLSFADLTGADLSQAELRRVLLRNANLTGANLEEADLAQANMRGATLTGALFAGANLSGADLTDATDFDEGGDASGFAVLSETTRCPGDGADEVVTARFSTSANRFTCAATAQGVPQNAQQLFLVSRSAAPGTVVGRVAATDRDADTLTYAVDDPGDPALSVDSRTGVITVATELGEGDVPDRRVELQVRVDDGTNPAEVVDVIIVIEAVNDPPEPVVTYLVRDDSPLGSRIGRIEPPTDWPGARAFQIEAGDSSGLFELDDAGVLTLSGKPQAGTSYVLNVRIGDSRLSTTLPVRVDVIAENAPPGMLAMEPLEVTAMAAADVVGTLAAEDPDGDELTYSIAAVEPPGEYFVIDAATGTVTLGPQQPPPGEYVLTVIVSDTGIPPRSVQSQVTVRIRQAVTASAARRYIVEDGGTLDVSAEDGVLSPEQRETGITAELTTRPAAGRLGEEGGQLLRNGSFSYTHVTTGFGPDVFAYRTNDASGNPSEPSEVAIAVLVAEAGSLSSASPAGEVAVRLSVLGIEDAAVDYGFATGSSPPFELTTGGTIVTTAGGGQLFAAGPWHDLEVVVTDLEFERATPVTVTVPISYVVAPGDSLNAVAAQVLESAAAAATPCPETADEYTAAISEASGTAGTLDPGDVLVVPDCRPG